MFLPDLRSNEKWLLCLWWVWYTHDTRQTQVSRDDDASGNDRAVFREKTYQVVALRRGRRSSHCASAHPVEFKKRKQQRVPGPTHGSCHGPHTTYEVRVHGRTNTKRDGGGAPTLRQTCRWPKPLAQGAFKTSMVHILQFTLRIAFRCVLHRYGSQDIRC